jgi:hypothetical protein
MYCIRRRLINKLQPFTFNSSVVSRFIIIKSESNAKIESRESKENTLTPSCFSCLHYNLIDSKCSADKFSPPIDSKYYRTDDLQTNCGLKGKYYTYYGPELAKENKKLVKNFGLSIISLGLSGYLFTVYPPYSMIICTVPLSLTAIYGLLLIEQTYIYNKMEKDEQQRLANKYNEKNK